MVQIIILDLTRVVSIAIFNVGYSRMMLLGRQEKCMFLKAPFCRILITHHLLSKLYQYYKHLNITFSQTYWNKTTQDEYKTDKNEIIHFIFIYFVYVLYIYFHYK